MLSKKQLELQKLPSKISAHPAYLGVNISGNKATATDGLVLAQITNKGSEQLRFGAITPKAPMTINLTGIKIGAKINSVPGAENVFFSKEDSETATLFVTDKINKRIYEIGKIDDEFPDVSRLIIDAQNQTQKMTVSGDELFKVASLLKTYREVTIRVSDNEDKAIFFEANDTETDAKVVLMKIKTDK